MGEKGWERMRIYQMGGASTAEARQETRPDVTRVAKTLSDHCEPREWHPCAILHKTLTTLVTRVNALVHMCTGVTLIFSGPVQNVRVKVFGVYNF